MPKNTLVKSRDLESPIFILHDVHRYYPLQFIISPQSIDAFVAVAQSGNSAAVVTREKGRLAT